MNLTPIINGREHGWCIRLARWLGCLLAVAAQPWSATTATAGEPGAQREWRQGERFSLVHQGQASCRILNTVTGENARIVETAIGQLNQYLSANYGAELPLESSGQLPSAGNWIVTAVGAVPSSLPETAALVEGIGDQGFLIRQIAAPSGSGRLLLVWGKTPLGCRYGLIELLRSLQPAGKDCFSDLAQVRDQPAFSHRIYYHNFGEHLLNVFSVNMLHDVPFARWTRADWRRYLEMIAAMRYTTFEFWLSPTLFSSPALGAPEGSKYDEYAKTMRWVIEQAHELGLKVEVLICVNCTEPTWVNLCPRLPDEHQRILALWSHWTKRLANADVLCIFPGDVGGCQRNGCTHETFVELCLEIIHATGTNGPFAFEIAGWGPPFYDWGVLAWDVPARRGSPERAKAAFAYLLQRLPEFPKGTVYSVNMNRDIKTSYSGAPKEPGYSNRDVVDELRKSVTVLTWDYYLSEQEEAPMPNYRVSALLQGRQEERRWGYSGGINYTMTPRLSVLTAFAAAEAYWNPDQTEVDVLRRFSNYVFGSPDVALKVFPCVAMVGQPTWQAFHERIKGASEVLRSTQTPKLSKLFVAPDADAYRQNLIYYTTTFERMAAVTIQAQEVTSLSGKAKLSEVKAWLATAPESKGKDRVKELLAAWNDFDLQEVKREYRSRVYGIYNLAVGPDVRADWINGHCQAFVGQFGIASFFDTTVKAGR